MYIHAPIIDMLNKMPRTTKTGHDTLQVCIAMLPLLENDNLHEEYFKFRNYIESLIKRSLILAEEVNLGQALVNFVLTKPTTEERMGAMIHLFTLEFIET